MWFLQAKTHDRKRSYDAESEKSSDSEDQPEIFFHIIECKNIYSERFGDKKLFQKEDTRKKVVEQG